MTQKSRSRRAVAAPLLLLVLACVLGGCESYRLDPPPPEQIAADAGEVVDPREIVALVPTTRAATRLGTGAADQGFVLRAQTALPGLGLTMLRFEFPQPLDGPAAIAALEAIEPGATAGLNHAYRPAAGNGLAGLDYANTLMEWPAEACRAFGPIGMIDTGVNAAIPELAGVRIIAESFQRGAPAPTRHGTEVAAILGDPRRLAEVTLYSAAVIGHSPRGQNETGVDGLLAALDWLAANDVRLVNISLSGPYNKLLDRGIDRARARGMIIVAAVGNDGAAASPRYPAALDNVIAVTAVDAGGAIYRNAVHGPQVDVAAPGVDILLRLDGRADFATGTSIAAPFVTARIATDPAFYNADSARIRAALAESSVDLGPPGPDPVFGAGLLVASPACQGR